MSGLIPGEEDWQGRDETQKFDCCLSEVDGRYSRDMKVEGSVTNKQKSTLDFRNDPTHTGICRQLSD